ncbi:MAG: hypothetical protein WAL03_09000 [Pseudolabrys sp.]
MDRSRAQACQDFLGFHCIGHKQVIFDVRVSLLNQPFLSVPGAIGALTSEPFHAARCTDILHAEPDKFPCGADLNVKETAASAAARFGALSPYAGFF